MQRFQQCPSAHRRNWPMFGWLGIAAAALAALAIGLTEQPEAYAQTAAGPAHALITQSINEQSLVTLPGNTRPEAKNPDNDRGRVADNLQLPHMLMQLRRPAAQEQALQSLIDQLHDPASPNFHHWLDAGQIGAQFGPAASDIAAVTGWLRQHGFTVNTVYSNGMTIDFSGTAGQVGSAFHTEIHNLSVNGVAHIANMSDPQIPAALAPVVVGIASLHDFKPHPLAVHGAQASPQFTSGSQYFISPPDLATIYNFNPLFTGGNSGQGQTIYLIEDTDLFSTSDWTTFRSIFGLSAYSSASLTTVHPGGCTDPGVSSGTNGNDAEAIIDAEYASAAAPSAAVVMATCADSPDGILSAVQGLINGSTAPAVMSISYGDCEADNGSASNAAYKSAYQTGVAEGWSIFVSAGDEGAGGCDDSETVTHGIAVSALASTIYNVAVGGTDYGDTYSGTNSTYWSSSNSAANGSAKSYVPEIPWNSTCASQLYATNQGFSTTYGTSGFCNSNGLNSFYKENWAGSGGPSACATGTPSVTDVVSGTCAGYAKPSWQSGLFGNPADSVRDLPDVSMFASFAPWNHSYVICFTDTSNDGVSSCSNPPNSSMGGWGGTSFGAPIWAGIQALVNQYTGSAQGNPNPVLYKLAATEYGASGNSSCNSSSGNGVGSSCVFYDVTLGDNDVPCKANRGTDYNCYLPSGTTGVLSTNNNAYAPAYGTTPGWDFATGIGTVNVYNLVTNWASGGGITELSVSVTGSGTVTSSPTGISCPSTCSRAFAGGTQVTLTATPASGWVFSSWSGACGGSGSCVVTINAAESVTATFTQAFTLSVTDSGSGTVTSSPPGISCGSACSASFISGTQVTLNETPASGWAFAGWGGACSGTGSCVVTMSAAENVSVTFTQIFYTLSAGMSGSGTLTSSPSGISCPSACSANYASGTGVTLTATPSAGWIIDGWGGACNGNGTSSTCNVTMSAAESVSVTFTLSGGTPASQTWVSAASGSDANPCTITEPCLTFATALAKTAAGGEIDVLSPGDYGPATITQGISIYNDGVLTVPGTSGITVSAGASDTINLRGLSFNGFTASGASGVVFNSGAQLHIANCVFQGFATSGIAFSPGSGSATTVALVVEDTTLINNAIGMAIKPTGGIAANVALRQIRLDKNTSSGLNVDGTGGSGKINAVLSDSSASLNAGNGITATGGTGGVTLNVMRVVAASNGAVGIQSSQSDGGTATVTVGMSTVYGNAVGVQSLDGGTLLSYANTQLTGNTTNGSFTGNASLQ